jgi:hypothetical protein
MEWLAATDPLDFYNGERPLLLVSCGKEWLLPAGELSQQALSVTVYHPDGRPWANAPVSIRSESGGAVLLAGRETGEFLLPELERRTDDLGHLHPVLDPVHVLAPSLPGESDSVVIGAGAAQARLRITSTGAAHGPPPRQLAREDLPDGSRSYTWSGDPGLAGSFVIEEQSASGAWTEVAHLSTDALAPPDAATGRYVFNLPIPTN